MGYGVGMWVDKVCSRSVHIMVVTYFLIIVWFTSLLVYVYEPQCCYVNFGLVYEVLGGVGLLLLGFALQLLLRLRYDLVGVHGCSGNAFVVGCLVLLWADDARVQCWERLVSCDFGMRVLYDVWLDAGYESAALFGGYLIVVCGMGVVLGCAFECLWVLRRLAMVDVHGLVRLWACSYTCTFQSCRSRAYFGMVVFSFWIYYMVGDFGLGTVGGGVTPGWFTTYEHKYFGFMCNFMSLVFAVLGYECPMIGVGYGYGSVSLGSWGSRLSGYLIVVCGDLWIVDCLSACLRGCHWVRMLGLRASAVVIWVFLGLHISGLVQFWIRVIEFFEAVAPGGWLVILGSDTVGSLLVSCCYCCGCLLRLGFLMWRSRDACCVWAQGFWGFTPGGLQACLWEGVLCFFLVGYIYRFCSLVSVFGFRDIDDFSLCKTACYARCVYLAHVFLFVGCDLWVVMIWAVVSVEFTYYGLLVGCAITLDLFLGLNLMILVAGILRLFGSSLSAMFFMEGTLLTVQGGLSFCGRLWVLIRRRLINCVSLDNVVGVAFVVWVVLATYVSTSLVNMVRAVYSLLKARGIVVGLKLCCSIRALCLLGLRWGVVFAMRVLRDRNFVVTGISIGPGLMHDKFAISIVGLWIFTLLCGNTALWVVSVYSYLQVLWVLLLELAVPLLNCVYVLASAIEGGIKVFHTEGVSSHFNLFGLSATGFGANPVGLIICKILWFDGFMSSCAVISIVCYYAVLYRMVCAEFVVIYFDFYFFALIYVYCCMLLSPICNVKVVSLL
eukprot:gene3422-2373_t